jgi:hypothetical protein
VRAFVSPDVLELNGVAFTARKTALLTERRRAWWRSFGGSRGSVSEGAMTWSATTSNSALQSKPRVAVLVTVTRVRPYALSVPSGRLLCGPFYASSSRVAPPRSETIFNSSRSETWRPQMQRQI